MKRFIGRGIFFTVISQSNFLWEDARAFQFEGEIVIPEKDLGKSVVHCGRIDSPCLAIFENSDTGRLFWTERSGDQGKWAVPAEIGEGISPKMDCGVDFCLTTWMDRDRKKVFSSKRANQIWSPTLEIGAANLDREKDSISMACNDNTENCVVAFLGGRDFSTLYVTRSLDRGDSWTGLVTTVSDGTSGVILSEAFLKCTLGGIKCILIGKGKRTGSKNEEVVMFRSNDKGSTWTNPVFVQGSTRMASKPGDRMIQFPVVSCLDELNCFVATIASTSQDDTGEVEISGTSDGGTSFSQFRTVFSQSSSDQPTMSCVSTKCVLVWTVKGDPLSNPRYVTFSSLGSSLQPMSFSGLAIDPAKRNAYSAPSLSCSESADLCITSLKSLVGESVHLTIAHLLGLIKGTNQPTNLPTKLPTQLTARPTSEPTFLTQPPTSLGNNTSLTPTSSPSSTVGGDDSGGPRSPSGSPSLSPSSHAGNQDEQPSVVSLGIVAGGSAMAVGVVAGALWVKRMKRRTTAIGNPIPQQDGIFKETHSGGGMSEYSSSLYSSYSASSGSLSNVSGQQPPQFRALPMAPAINFVFRPVSTPNDGSKIDV